MPPNLARAPGEDKKRTWMHKYRRPAGLRRAVASFLLMCQRISDREFDTFRTVCAVVDTNAIVED